MSKLSIRTCGRDEVALLLSWARAEGWNPGLHDAVPFHAADPAGFFLGYQNDEAEAGISAVRYGPKFGFLGLYIVKAERRGQGLGIQMWHRAMRHFEGTATVGLDGVVAQQANYARSGFALAYRQVRFGGPAPATKASLHLTPLSQVPFDELIRFDGLHFGAVRPGFLGGWTGMPESRGWAWLEQGRVRGYGVRRRCHEGYKIGPLFAESATIAAELFEGLCADVAGDTIFVDVPEPNKQAVELAERAGLKAVFETARMYKGPAATFPREHVFGVTTFELG